MSPDSKEMWNVTSMGSQSHVLNVNPMSPPDSKLFSIKQYGFRTGQCTELAALHLVNDLTKQMDTGKFPTNIY